MDIPWPVGDKLALGQCRSILHERIQSKFKSIGHFSYGVFIERVTNKSRHPNVTSLCATIEQNSIATSVPALQAKNGSSHQSQKVLYNLFKQIVLGYW